MNYKMFRRMEETDVCCKKEGNLTPGMDNDKVIDGCFVCKECDKCWIGKGSDPHSPPELETLTELGERYLSAMDDVIREGKPLRYKVVMGRAIYKDREGMEKCLAEAELE